MKCAALAFLLAAPVFAQAPVLEPLGLALENHPYPHPVHFFPVTVEGQDLRMAYMDVAPTAVPNGQTVLLLHGKNFFGAYWTGTIQALTAAGYRVVVPDQLGFGKSPKPDIHYSFELLAQTTMALLDRLGVAKVSVVGHSMGGMLAVRFVLLYPAATARLVLENPIGLEDYRAKVPFASVDTTYRSMLSPTREGLDRFYRTYFATWKPEFGVWAELAWRATLSGEWPRGAKASALTYDMIYTQPVVQDLPRITVPTLLVIGQADRTTLGRGALKPEVLATLGRYPELGRRAQTAIPGAQLVPIDGVGHIPHLESPERFHQALLAFLK
ncbi:alpha/beta fold hydrolase [Geothrix oryzisoli]|uniref:alpha/beta fold hydrolase n=1 Tax=Geothrix oryzisoli TaxID=2922721 RepID=UPI001FAD5E27|nr:alpha/beta hydrolase [Geothrix oryzisoli]